MTTFKNRKFLIIGGTSKAGTTSLYSYLADHPQICASSLKETRFFLDSDYPLPVSAQFNEDLLNYEKYFCHCESSPNATLMEATPDYLYSTQALRITELLPNSKIIFILRDPIERLVSWFKYAKQRGMLEQEETFQSYIEYQLNNSVTVNTPVHLRALEQGRYLDYLESFLQTDKENILVISYVQLKTNVNALMREICNFSHIDYDFFENYNFQIENESKKVKHIKIDMFYRYLRRSILHRVLNIKWLLHFFQFCNKPIKAAFKYNYKTADIIDVPPTLKNQLELYYAKEINFLGSINARKQ